MYSSAFQFETPAETFLPRPRVATVYDKGSGSVNEDLLHTGGRTFGVFDGATSLISAQECNGLSGGRIAAEICRDVFADEELDLSARAEKANRRIYSRSRAAGIDYQRKEELWSCSAAVLHLHADFFDWCQMGDCQILVIYRDGSYRLLTQNPGHDVDTLRLWQKRAADLNGNVLEIMADDVIRVRRRMNVDFGVFSGEKEALDFLDFGRESLAEVADVLLFSDGLFLPQENPGDSQDLAFFVSLYRQGGLERIWNYVRNRQLEDISCKKYPRFKTHDDISGVALSFQ